MKTGNAVYWVATIVTGPVFLAAGAANVLRAEAPLRAILALGYPAYLLGILGAWKVLGAVAILAPGLPRLKEWAYAGITFDLTGAALSHAAVGDPAPQAIAPLLLLGVAAASWALRPASRVLAR
ncbi:MAG: DoxX family protein [Caldimonas sp.]